MNTDDNTNGGMSQPPTLPPVKFLLENYKINTRKCLHGNTSIEYQKF